MRQGAIACLCIRSVASCDGYRTHFVCCVCANRCGYFNNTFVAYTSPDLESWTLSSPDLVPAIAADAASIEYDEVYTLGT